MGGLMETADFSSVLGIASVSISDWDDTVISGTMKSKEIDMRNISCSVNCLRELTDEEFDAFMEQLTGIRRNRMAQTVSERRRR